MKQNNYLWIISTYIFALPYSRQRLFKMYVSHTTVSYRTNRSHNGDNARNQTISLMWCPELFEYRF